jgi:hypothetical protein
MYFGTDLNTGPGGVMRTESLEVLKAVSAYNLAHEGDSDDDEIDAAFGMKEAALRLVKIIAISDPVVAKCFADFRAAVNG